MWAGNDCCPAGLGQAWEMDGHSEIIGGRGPVPPKLLGFRLRINSECSGGDPCNWGINWPARTWSVSGGYTNGNSTLRVQLLMDLEHQSWNLDNPASDTWVHRPYNSGLCLVSAGLVATFESMNKPPIADAGSDQMIECDSCTSAIVILDADESFDPDGDSLMYTWNTPLGSASGELVEFEFSLGVHCVMLEVEDTVGHIARDYVTVSIVDQTSPITPYVSAAGPWKQDTDEYEAYAFDEFFPGTSGSSGCLLDDPLEPVTINIKGGSITVTADDNGSAYCAITDSGTGAAHSDARLNSEQSVVTLDFDPPIIAFYTYYGSLAVHQTATMQLYSAQDSIHLGSVTTLPSMDNVLASGAGFTSNVPVNRIEFTATEAGSVVVGAFNGLLPGEPSLGTVNILGYPGPNGSAVELDFAVVFANVCPADLTGDGVVDVSDLLQLLSAWGLCTRGGECPADISGDDVVDVSDLLVLISAWGVCPDN